MEERSVPAIILSGTTLSLYGDQLGYAANDTMTIDMPGGGIRVTINGATSEAAFYSPGQVTAIYRTRTKPGVIDCFARSDQSPDLLRAVQPLPLAQRLWGAHHACVYQGWFALRIDSALSSGRFQHRIVPGKPVSGYPCAACIAFEAPGQGGLSPRAFSDFANPPGKVWGNPPWRVP